MSKEQIEEMAKDLQKSEHWYFNETSVEFELDRRKTSKNLYNAGYRKQSEGEWENVGDDMYELCFRCSNCREEFSCEVDIPIFAKYCPNCGAKMKGGAG